MEIEKKKLVVEMLFDPSKSSSVSNEEIFTLGLRSMSDVSQYILEEFYDAKKYEELGTHKSSFTKRKHRVWNLVKDSMTQIRSLDQAGIYSLKKRYSGGVLAYIVAKDKQEALTLGEMFLGYLLPAGSKLEAIFYDFRHENLMLKNQELLNSISKKIESQERSIAFLEKDTSVLSLHKKNLRNYY